MMITETDITEEALLSRGFVRHSEIITGDDLDTFEYVDYRRDDWHAYHLSQYQVIVFHPTQCSQGENMGVRFDSLEELDKVLTGLKKITPSSYFQKSQLLLCANKLHEYAEAIEPLYVAGKDELVIESQWFIIENRRHHARADVEMLRIMASHL